MRLVYGGEGVGVGWWYEISCVLSRKGDVGAWVLLCRPAGTIVPTSPSLLNTHEISYSHPTPTPPPAYTSMLSIYQPEDDHKSRNM